MKKLTILISSILAMALVVGCGDDDKPVNKDGGSDAKHYFDGSQDDSLVLQEGGGGDTTPQGDCDENIIGKPCKADADCGAGHGCLGFEGEEQGMCTCSCTPDNPDSPLVDEDSCPQPSSVCGSLEMSDGSTKTYCVKYCDPKLGANDCGTGFYCDSYIAAVLGLIGRSVCLLPVSMGGCAADEDCPVTTSATCDTGNPASCPTGEKCLKMTTVDTITEGLCAKAGKCDTISGLCDKKPAALSKMDAKVGDPCTDDTQCADNMDCMLEFDKAKWQKKGGEACKDDYDCCSYKCENGTCATEDACIVVNRNGYCTIRNCYFSKTLPHAACPAGSTCSMNFINDGACLKTCALDKAGDCRGNANDYLGDYECRDWTAFGYGDVKIADMPTCDPGYISKCSDWDRPGSQYTCANVGDQSNSTKMSCRDLAGTELTNKFDPAGYCMDNTNSGTKVRSPMPTP